MSHVPSASASRPVRPIEAAAIGKAVGAQVRALGNKAVQLFRTGEAEQIPTVVSALASRLAQRLQASDLSRLSSARLDAVLGKSADAAYAAVEPIDFGVKLASGQRAKSSAHDALMSALQPLVAERAALPRLRDDVAAAGRTVHAADARVPPDALPMYGGAAPQNPIENVIGDAIAGAQATGTPVYFVWEEAPHIAFPPSDPRAKDQRSRLEQATRGAARASPAFAKAHAAQHGALVVLRREEALNALRAAEPGSGAAAYAKMELEARRSVNIYGGHPFFREAFEKLTAPEIVPFINEVKRRGVIPSGPAGFEPFGKGDFYGDQAAMHFYKHGFPDSNRTAAVWEREWK